MEPANKSSITRLLNQAKNNQIKLMKITLRYFNGLYYDNYDFKTFTEGNKFIETQLLPETSTFRLSIQEELDKIPEWKRFEEDPRRPEHINLGVTRFSFLWEDDESFELELLLYKYKWILPSIHCEYFDMFSPKDYPLEKILIKHIMTSSGQYYPRLSLE